MRVTVSLADSIELKAPSREDETIVVVHFGDQDLEVRNEVEATVTINSLEHEVDAAEVSLPDSIIRTCRELQLGHITTLQELFDTLEEMEIDINYEEGTRWKK